MKYTLRWTQANGDGRHLRKAYSFRVIERTLRRIMPSVKSKKGLHAVLITLALSVDDQKK